MSKGKFSEYKDLGIISLTTFYKSGKAVATPVDYRKYDDNTLYVSTAKNSYKIKRIKANPKATIAPCTMSGKLKGEIIDVTVRILNENEEEKGKEMVAPIYKKLINRIILLFKKGPRHYLEIT